jgi:nitrate/nitrite transporter NarK
MKQNFKKIWRIPVLLSALILFGLLAALLGTGIWYWLAWVAMAIPLFVICLKVWKPNNRVKENVIKN